MDAHLAKPINPREMLDAVCHWAATQRAEDSEAEQQRRG